MEYNITATSTFGLESVLADELRDLGFEDLKVENGKVSFVGTEEDIAICNIWLRTADRVLIQLAQFYAESFDELFEEASKIQWSEFMPIDARMHVNGKSIKSKLFSISDCQAIVKKAIIENMKRKYKQSWFSEDGDMYKIEVALLKDVATITLDTTGLGLHKRGYREESGNAPLKETLAAAMVLLSKWDPSRALSDPFCGSGTIPIEAALIGRNIAPGLNREFAGEKWSWLPPEVWTQVREDAHSRINDFEFRILGSDIDGWVIKTAKENAVKAGLENYVAFQKLDVNDFASRKKYSCIITNPPYGERIGDKEKVRQLYIDFGKVYKTLDECSCFTLTSNPDFEELFGIKANKNRKLYNGNLLCYLYYHFGRLPRRIIESDQEIKMTDLDY